MQQEHQIVSRVYAAKDNSIAADELIKDYIPFILSEASKSLSHICTQQDDEFSISMIAFHEAIQGYSKDRGSFLNYAAMLIKSRLIDYQRKEFRHKGHISLDERDDEDSMSLQDTLVSDRNEYEERDNLEATKQEIDELSSIMNTFGVSFTDVADNSPKQDRTLETCRKVINYAIENPNLLDELLQTKKLPLAQLVSGSGVERKTLERHRKYLIAMLIIQTNGYEIVRGHLRHILKGKEVVQ